MRHREESGFTLIELLIVIAIIDFVLWVVFGISSALVGGLYSAVRGV